jgi:hypothetical protein
MWLAVSPYIGVSAGWPGAEKAFLNTPTKQWVHSPRPQGEEPESYCIGQPILDNVPYFLEPHYPFFNEDNFSIYLKGWYDLLKYCA